MDIRLKEIPYEYLGKTYLLRCNMNVLADVQEEFGGNLSNALRSRRSLKTLTAFLAAMLNDYADEMGWDEHHTTRSVGRNIKYPEAIRMPIFELILDALSTGIPADAGADEQPVQGGDEAQSPKN